MKFKTLKHTSLYGVAAKLTTLLFFILSIPTSAQIFQEVPIENSIRQKAEGYLTSADFNKDGYDDLVVAGKEIDGNSIITIYLNNKEGEFVETSNDFGFIRDVHVATGDINRDGHLDLLITGSSHNSFNLSITEVYFNNGLGDFTKKENHGIAPIHGGDIKLEDLNKDGILDAILTGWQAGVPWFNAVIYYNDGKGVFTELLGTTFIGVSGGSISIADVDNNGEKDLLFTGDRTGQVPETKLYLNLGEDLFVEDEKVPFIKVRNSSSLFKDFNGDGFVDLLLMGRSVHRGNVSLIYENDGSGVFHENQNLSFKGLYRGSIYAEDFNGDGLEDIILQGQHYLSASENILLYVKESNGGYKPAIELSNQIGLHAMTLLDMENDGDFDFVIAGSSGNNIPFSSIYLNDGQAKFKTKSKTVLDGLEEGLLGTTDFDRDGDLDILMLGKNELGITESSILVNDGLGSFSKNNVPKIVGVTNGTFNIIDFQNDSIPEIFITGLDENQLPITRLYTSFSGNYMALSGTQLPDVVASSVSSSDFNKDGILDLAIVGNNALGEPFTRVFLNSSNSIFTEQAHLIFDTLTNGVVSSGDINNDGSPDIFLMGEDAAGDIIALFYLNNEDGSSFSLYEDNEITGYLKGQSVLEDLDNDGDLDLIVTGTDKDNRGQTELYHNNGEGVFTQIKGTFLAGYAQSSLLVEDVNRDGFLDFYVTGELYDKAQSNLYLNNGNGIFSEFRSATLSGVYRGGIVAGDFNGDHLVDIMEMGRVDDSEYVRLRLYAQSPLSLSTRDKLANSSEDIFTIFPNPTEGQIVNISSSVKGDYILKVFNSIGQMMYQQSYDALNAKDVIQIDCKFLPNGLYYVSLSNEKLSGTQKMIISR